MEQYGNGPQQPSPAQQHFQASKVLQQSALGLGYPRSPGGAQTASPLNAKAYPQHPQSQSPVHAFMSALQAHLAPKGTPIVAPLVVDGKQVDFFRLFQRESILKLAQILPPILTPRLAHQSSRAQEGSPRYFRGFQRTWGRN